MGDGDWLDASQAPQGSRAYASAAINAVGAVNVQVGELVSRWVRTGLNRGFFLKPQPNTAVTFVGRTNADTARRPRLVVNTDRGSFDVPCICNSHWDVSTYTSFDTRAQFQVTSAPILAIVQFDLSSVSGTVQSATLTLSCSALGHAGGINVFEADPPTFRIGGGGAAATQGIAKGFSQDRNIGAHPSVLFAADFSVLGKPNWQQGSIEAGATSVLDSATQSKYVRAAFNTGELGSCSLEHQFATVGAQGALTSTAETELYARYYVYLESDWGSTVDANKMPGWDARYGWWSTEGGGYWEPTTGNGGTPPTGLKVWNATQNKWEYQGASLRGHGGPKIGDGNPYDNDLFWAGNYMYHLDQEGPYGEEIKWNATMFTKGKWYCIEQHCKMNSISGPLDANGNGTANRDGIYRAWVDGVLVWERTNFRWRRNAEMGLHGFWLNWYHGGTNPPVATMHYRMNSVVIAREYIGPRNDG